MWGGRPTTRRAPLLGFFAYEIDHNLGYPKFDFCYACARSSYWSTPIGLAEYREIETKDDVTSYFGGIPVGSVEFVKLYTEKVYKRKLPPPWNVPKPLWPKEFSGRKIFEGDEMKFRQGLAAKSATETKGYSTFPVPGLTQQPVPKGYYQYSTALDPHKIESEWRVFVWKDFIRQTHYIEDVRKYQGPWHSPPPDERAVRAMIEAFAPDAPIAYTLDVAVYEGRTVVIEVHDFYSIGLYGYDDYEKYANMCLDWYREFLDKL